MSLRPERSGLRSAHFLRRFVVTLTLAACSATPPTGPSVLAPPPAGEDLAQFSLDDGYCRAYAQLQSGGSAPQQPESRKTATGAVVGSGVGAATGALTGAAVGQAGAGAAIGAGSGLPVGSAVGASYASMSTAELQQRYDLAYAQCMAARGNTVQPPTFAWGYGSYAYPYLDWGYYSPWFGPSLTFGFLSVRDFRHHDFDHHGFHIHGTLHGGVQDGFHGGSHRG